MAVTKKITMQGDVFEGISSVFALNGGLPAGLDLSDASLTEFPVSDDSGFNFDTGAPSIERFKVKGLATDWVNTFTPGDGEIKLEVPCHNTNILSLVGMEGKAATVKLPAGVSGEAAATATGMSYPVTQKAVYLGLLILNDTEDMLLFIKKVKLMAQLIFDGSNKPLCVVLTGSVASGGDTEAIGIATIGKAS